MSHLQKLFSHMSSFCVLEKIPEMKPFSESLVDATIRVYSTITSALLPTPAKSHYTFNLRDLSKVFQGILMADAGKIEVPPLINHSFSDISCFIYLDLHKIV